MCINIYILYIIERNILYGIRYTRYVIHIILCEHISNMSIHLNTTLFETFLKYILRKRDILLSKKIQS